jgi:hypothetical protein
VTDGDSDPFIPVGGGSYSRLHHFKGWLASVQGRGAKLPPSADAEIARRVSAHEGSVTREVMTAWLREMGRQQYYDSVWSLLDRHCGIAPIHIPPEVEADMLTRFKQIQGPFHRAVNRLCPGRLNLLGFEYLVRRLLQLAGRGDLSRDLKLVRSRAKLRQLDGVWRAICHELGWEYLEHVHALL